MKLHNVDLAQPNNIHSVLARDKLNKIWKSTSQINNFEPKRQKNLKSVVEINHLLNLPLGETISSPTQIIDVETNILENNYQSKYLSSHREGIKLKILVIEDRDDSRNYICKLLRAENFQVIEAKDSPTAIRLADAETPDLIICELMMPITDGHDVINSLCHSTVASNILPLFITAHHRETKIGAEIFLISDLEAIEPLTKEKLLKAINRHLKMMTV